MDQIEIHWLWWLVAAVALGVVEILTLDLVLLMLAAGALAALISSLFGAGVTVQVLTFALTYVVVNMATDLVYGLIDPRIRLSSEAR